MKDIIIPTLSLERLNTIFRNSLAQKTSTEVIKVTLFQKENGFQEDSKPIYFDKKIVDNNKQGIEYLLGQLKDVHEGKASTSLESAKQRYDEQWTTNTNATMALLHLALAADLIKPVDKSTAQSIFTTNIIPTLHTLDSNFPSWYKNTKPKLLKKYFGEGPEK